MSLLNGGTVVEGDFVSTSAGAGDSGKVPKLGADGYMSAEFLKFTLSLGTTYPLSGATTPQAVCSLADGTIALSDGNGPTAVKKFIGFVSENNSLGYPTFLYKNDATTGTVSLTIPAGDDVILFVSADQWAGSLPTSYTFNGNAMTAGITQASGSGSGKFWYIVLGNIASPLTANLVRTGGTITHQTAIAYNNVNQASPFQDSDTSTNGTDITSTAINNKYSAVLCCAGGGNPTSISNSGFTYRSQDTGAVSFLIGEHFANDTVVSDFLVGGSTWSLVYMLNTSTTNAPSVSFKYRGIIAGFTGLTKGATYYVTDTSGAISTTAGTTSIPVGIAYSTTQILILASQL